MNVPPFIEFMCGMGTTPSSQNSSHGLPTTQTTGSTATINPGLEQQREETNEETLQMTEQNHHEDLSCIQTDGEEWSLFDFSSNPPFCCTDSTVDMVFRLPVTNSMGGDVRGAALTELSRGMALFETEEGEDEDEVAAGVDVNTSMKEEDPNSEESFQEEEEKAKEGAGIEASASPVAFHPPFFRSMTFHSVSARSDDIYEYDRNRRPTLIPNDASTTISSSPTSLSRSQASNSLDETYNIEPLPIDFVPPRHNFIPTTKTTTTTAVNGQAQVQQEYASDQGYSFESSLSFSGSGSGIVKPRDLQECFTELRPQDIICGRGQPTLTHPGNVAFKEVMQEHEMTYLCARRSEKPKIAWALLDEFRAKGVRFVKREKRGLAVVDHPATVTKSKDDNSLHDDEYYVWVEIGDKRAYAKITQSLREEAPQLRRQLLGSTKTDTTAATTREPSSDDLKRNSTSATRAADKKIKKTGKASAAKSSQMKNKKSANNKRIGEARDEVNVNTEHGITTAPIVSRQDSTSTVVEPQLSESETEGSAVTSTTSAMTTTQSKSTNTMKSLSPASSSSSSSSFFYDHYHHHHDGRHRRHHYSMCNDSNPYYYYYHQHHHHGHGHGHGHHGYYGYYSNNYDYYAMNRNNSNSCSGGS